MHHLDPLDKTDQPVCITPLHKLVQVGHWRTDILHSNPFHRLIWFTRGQGRMTLEAQDRLYGAFGTLFLPAGTCHSFEVKQAVFGVAIDIAPHANLDMPDYSFYHRLLDVGDQRRFGALVDTLQSELSRPQDADVADLNSRALRHQAGLMGVWLERRVRAAHRGRKITPAQRLVTAYLNLIEKRIGDGDNVASLAADLGVTPTHLTRCCRKTLSRSALEVLNQRLHHKARMALITSDLSVKDIAAQVGFASAAYFTRSFQNMSGQTPSDFRITGARSN